MNRIFSHSAYLLFHLGFFPSSTPPPYKMNKHRRSLEGSEYKRSLWLHTVSDTQVPQRSSIILTVGKNIAKHLKVDYKLYRTNVKIYSFVKHVEIYSIQYIALLTPHKCIYNNRVLKCAVTRSWYFGTLYKNNGIFIFALLIVNIRKSIADAHLETMISLRLKWLGT